VSTVEKKKKKVRPARELTREEYREIRDIVVTSCINYDSEYGCLPLDYGKCYMLDKRYTGSCCKYFRETLLQQNPILKSVLAGQINITVKECPICGSLFVPIRSQVYCTEHCRTVGQREKNRRRQQKRRREIKNGGTYGQGEKSN